MDLFSSFASLSTYFEDDPDAAEARAAVRQAARAARADELGEEEEVAAEAGTSGRLPRSPPKPRGAPTRRPKQPPAPPSDEAGPGSAAAREQCVTLQQPARLSPDAQCRRRQRLLSEFRELLPTATLLSSDRLEVTFLTRGSLEPNALRIVLPPSFPASPPQLRLAHPLPHPWVRPLPGAGAGASLSCPLLADWDARRSALAPLVFSLLGQLAARRGPAANAAPLPAALSFLTLEDAAGAAGARAAPPATDELDQLDGLVSSGLEMLEDVATMLGLTASAWTEPEASPPPPPPQPQPLPLPHHPPPLPSRLPGWDDETVDGEGDEGGGGGGGAPPPPPGSPAAGDESVLGLRLRAAAAEKVARWDVRGAEAPPEPGTLPPSEAGGSPPPSEASGRSRFSGRRRRAPPAARAAEQPWLLARAALVLFLVVALTALWPAVLARFSSWVERAAEERVKALLQQPLQPPSAPPPPPPPRLLPPPTTASFAEASLEELERTLAEMLRGEAAAEERVEEARRAAEMLGLVE